MWPFHQPPTSRLQHRLLKRLRIAYLVTEDLTSYRLANDHLRLIGTASQQAADDETLYAHWTAHPMPLPLANAVITDTKAWHHLLTSVQDLVTQGYHPHAYAKEARSVGPVGDVIRDLIQYELVIITHPDRAPDDSALRAKARLTL